MKKKTVLIGLGIVDVFLVGFIYYSFDPTIVKWMPKCPFQLLTGFDCPACGNQRALHALLHGRVLEAFLFNPFLFISLPYLFLLIVSFKSNSGLLGRIHDLVQHRMAVNCFVIAICAWWILRNVLPL